MEQPNQERIRTLGEKENYKYLGLLEAVTIIQAETKRKTKEERVISRNQTLLQESQKK